MKKSFFAFLFPNESNFDVVKVTKKSYCPKKQYDF